MFTIRAASQCLSAKGKIPVRTASANKRFATATTQTPKAAPKSAASAAPAPAAQQPASVATKFVPGYVPTTKAEKQAFKELAEKEGRLGQITQVWRSSLLDHYLKTAMMCQNFTVALILHSGDWCRRGRAFWPRQPSSHPEFFRGC